MTKAPAGINSSLIRLADAVLSGDFSDMPFTSLQAPGDAPNAGSTPLINDAGDRVLAEVVFADVSKADVEAALEAAGIEIMSPDGEPYLHINEIVTAAGTIRTFVGGYYPAEHIATLGNLLSDAGMSGQFVAAEPILFESSVGSVTSQGDVAQRSDDARAQFGVDGTGVTVGILSDSFSSHAGSDGTPTLTTTAQDIASGDLPANVNILQDSTAISSFGDEGRAMAQLIFDVAPGADLAFHTANGGQGNFASGIVELRTIAGSDVIVDDIIYFAEPIFQDGIVAQAVETVVADGAVFFSSAGNNSDDAFTDTFRDSGIDGDTIAALAAGVGTGLGNLHDWNPDPLTTSNFVELTIPDGDDFTISFQWDEPYAAAGGSGSTSDLDIYITLVDGAQETLLDSGFSNNLNGNPIEFVDHTNDSGGDQTIRIYITEFNPSDTVADQTFAGIFFSSASGFVREDFDPEIVGFLGTREDAPQFDAPTVFGHSNAENALSVGAAAFFNTPEFNSGLSAARLNSFSSEAGYDIRFDEFGNRLATPEDRGPVDFVAPDGGNTTFFGADSGADADNFGNFFGTSAAAPHAAAVAALLLERNDALTPQEVETALEGSATPVTLDSFGRPVGTDFTGTGFIDAVAALASVTSSGESASLIVTTADDVVADDGFTSLREAISFVNDGTLSGTITFAAGTGEAFENGGTIRLTLGTSLTITDTVTIDGDTNDDGTADVTITGDVNSDDALVNIADGPLLSDPKFNTNDADNIRVFDITGGDVTLDGLVITGGRAAADAGGVFVDNAAGSTTITNSFIGGNESDTGGGGLGIGAGSTLTLSNSSVAENVSDTGNGAGINVAGVLNSTSDLIFSNQATTGNGGGVAIGTGATALFDGTLIASNTADQGGGIFDDGSLYTGSDAGTFEVRGNTAATTGGGLFISAIGSAYIAEANVNTNDSGAGGGAIYNLSGSGLAIVGSTISTNTTFGDGGGVFHNGGTLNISNSTISGNSTTNGEGGGIAAAGSSTLTIQGGSVVDGNSADGDGGGVDLQDTASLTLTNSSVSNNSADDNGGGLHLGDQTSATIDGLSLIDANFSFSDGGGIAAEGTAILTLTNSTLSNNGAEDDGGGIHLDTGSSATINELSLVDGNTAGQNGGGLFATGAGFTISNATVQGNTATLLNGGGLVLTSGTVGSVNGNSFILGNTAGQDAGGILNYLSSLYVNESTVDGNTAARYGGGIYNRAGDGDSVSIGTTEFRGNMSANGGALANGTNSNVTTTIDNSIFDQNTATGGFGGGGIASVSGTLLVTNSSFTSNTTPGPGGGINNGVYADLILINSLLSGNSSTNDDGGGLYHHAGSGDTNEATIINSTFYGNSASNGGGASIGSDIANIYNSTFTGNVADDLGGGLFVGPTSTVNVTNSLLAGNGAGLGGDDIGASGLGTLALEGTNLLGTLPGNFNPGGYDAADDIILGAGAAYGLTLTDVFREVATNAITGIQSGVLRSDLGIPATVALNQNGIAIDAGDDLALVTDTFDIDGDLDTAEVLPLDQRGALRVTNGASDIGAVEDQFPGNLNPTTLDDAGVTYETSPIVIDLVSNDSDVDLDFITVFDVDSGTSATLITNNNDGTVTYDPSGAFDALEDGEILGDTFTYTIIDSRGGIATGSVDVTVFGVSDGGILGTSEDDTLIGDELDNVLRGLAGDDSLSGGDGNDTIIGGLGTDTLIGGDGNDVLIAGNPPPPPSGGDGLTNAIDAPAAVVPDASITIGAVDAPMIVESGFAAAIMPEMFGDESPFSAPSGTGQALATDFHFDLL